MTDEIEELAGQVIDAAMQVHVDIGPGLFESVYETLLANRLQKFGLHVDRQLPVKARLDVH